MTGSGRPKANFDAMVGEFWDSRPHYLGVDPGSTGAFAVVSHAGELCEVVKTPDGADPIHQYLELAQRLASDYHGLKAFVEQVNAGGAGRGTHGRKQGVSSLAKQARNIAYAKMSVAAARIPFEVMMPTTWLKVFGMKRAKGGSSVEWKTELYEKAKQLYPQPKFPKYAADAVLIAEACRRHAGVKPTGRKAAGR